jgi:hypothetical protein
MIAEKVKSLPEFLAQAVLTFIQELSASPKVVGVPGAHRRLRTWWEGRESAGGKLKMARIVT